MHVDLLFAQYHLARWTNQQNIIHINTAIELSFNNKESLCFVDFKKAFQSLNCVLPYGNV